MFNDTFIGYQDMSCSFHIFSYDISQRQIYFQHRPEIMVAVCDDYAIFRLHHYPTSVAKPEFIYHIYIPFR